MEENRKRNYQKCVCPQITTIDITFVALVIALNINVIANKFIRFSLDVNIIPLLTEKLIVFLMNYSGLTDELFWVGSDGIVGSILRSYLSLVQVELFQAAVL
jgi:hypothetical protein